MHEFRMKSVLVIVIVLLIGSASPAYAQQDGEQDPPATAESTETMEDDPGEATVEDELAEAADDQVQDETVIERRRSVRRLGDVVAEEEGSWSLDIPVEAPPRVTIPAVRLTDPARNARLQDLLIRRSYESESPEFQMETGLLLEELEADARQALDSGNIDAASESLAAIAALDSTRPGLAALRTRVQAHTQIQELTNRAAAALEQGNLVAPEGESALDHYRAILAADEANETAQSGLATIQERLLAEALELANDLDFEAAEAKIDQAAGILSNEPAIADAREATVRVRAERITGLDRDVIGHIDAGHYDAAESGITQLIALGGNRERINHLRQSLEDARLYGGFQPGQEFSDAMTSRRATAPLMVVLPAGNFQMGSPDSERERAANEGPRFRVTFARGFALGKNAVTVGEFQAFVEETGYITDAERQGWSRVYDADTGRIDRRNRVNWRQDYMGRRAEPELPVVHVSWRDATAYVEWLAEQTNRRYRLPSEAEYEYALRAGSQSTYWWGEGTPDDALENVAGDGDSSTTRRRWTVAFRRYSDGHWGPAEVGSFPPNPFGLHDMGGNVMSWTEDCWHDSYVRAPTDGTAWVNPGCDRRVIRGGSWAATPAMARSAFRLASGDDGRDARVGFRVARDL